MDRQENADDNAEHLYKYSIKQNDNIKKYFTSFIIKLRKSMSETNSPPPIDYYSTIKSIQNEKDKDMLISKLNQELKKLSSEFNRISKENSDLKIKYSLNHDVQIRLKAAEETIKDLREKNLKLMLEHKNQESFLENKINSNIYSSKKSINCVS